MGDRQWSVVKFRYFVTSNSLNSNLIVALAFSIAFGRTRDVRAKREASTSLASIGPNFAPILIRLLARWLNPVPSLKLRGLKSSAIHMIWASSSKAFSSFLTFFPPKSRFIGKGFCSAFFTHLCLVKWEVPLLLRWTKNFLHALQITNSCFLFSKNTSWKPNQVTDVFWVSRKVSAGFLVFKYSSRTFAVNVTPCEGSVELLEVTVTSSICESAKRYKTKKTNKKKHSIWKFY